MAPAGWWGGAAPPRLGVAEPGACGENFLGYQNLKIPFLNKNSVLAWKYTLLEILKNRHIEINTKSFWEEHAQNGRKL